MPAHLHRTLMRALPLAALAGIVACEGDGSPTAPSDSVETTETDLRAEGPPTASGPIVIRFEQEDQCFAFPATDQVSGYGSFQCFIDIVAACEGNPKFFTQETQVVQPPVGAGVLVRLERTDEMYVAIGEESFLDHRDSCEDFLGNLVAEGVAMRRETDNDQLASGTRTNAWGWMLHGVLDLAEGGQARYREILRVASGANATYTIDLDPID